MYANRFGRFTAVDPLLASGKSANPQSFNRYVYVENRPLSLSDPSGQCPIGECPTAYSGTVYFKNIDGRGLVYNNEQEDESWKVFEGDTVIWRDDNRGYARINQFGWYGMNTGEVLSYMANNLNSSSTAIAGFGRDLTFFDQTRLTFTAMGKSSYNAVADFDNLFYSTAEKLSLFSPVNLPRVERWQPVNTFESKQMQATDLALLGISIYSSAGAVSAARTASVSGATSSTAVQFEQYALTARRSGLYPVMQRGAKDPVGTVFLNKGDVWKYGQTMNPASRYSGAFLKNTGSGLRFESQFSTTSYKTVLQMELQKITQYEIRFGQLPAGNKIRR